MGSIGCAVRVPLFRGYLFLRHAIDDATSYLEVCKARGLVRMLGERWDRARSCPRFGRSTAIQKLVRSDLPVFPIPILREGQRVRITHGPLADVEGVLVRGNPKKGLFVVSGRSPHGSSVAVQLGCTAAAGCIEKTGCVKNCAAIYAGSFQQFMVAVDTNSAVPWARYANTLIAKAFQNERAVPCRGTCLALYLFVIWVFLDLKTLQSALFWTWISARRQWASGSSHVPSASLRRERKQARAVAQAVCLMLLELSEPSETRNGNLLNRAVRALLSAIRETDIAGWHQEQLTSGSFSRNWAPSPTLGALRPRVTTLSVGTPR